MSQKLLALTDRTVNLSSTKVFLAGGQYSTGRRLMSRLGLRLLSVHHASSGLAFAGLLATTILGSSQAFATTPCSALVSLPISNTTVTSATMVPATGSTPAYCNVLATVAPQTDIQVQLPANWKNRYLHLGGAGFDGRIPTTAPASY